METENEKLIELLKQADIAYTQLVHETSFMPDKVKFTAEYLADNGVTIQKHGRWIKDGDVVYCSECGEEHEWEDYRASFCEDCGAKMGGERKNDG